MDIKLNVQDLNHQAATLLLVGNLPVAKEKLDKAIEIDPMYVENYRNYGKYYLQSGAYEDAKNSYKKALLIKKDGETYFMYGNACFLNDEPHEGLKNYNLAIESGYDSDEMYFFTGLAYEQLNENEMALRYYNKACIMNPMKPEFISKKIGLFLKLNMIESAEKSIDELIKLSPESFEGYHYKTQALIAQKKYKKAVEFSKTAFEKFPEDVDLLVDYAKSLALDGNYEESTKLVEQSKKMEYFEGSKRDILYLEAQLTAEKGDNEKAKQLCRECLEIETGQDDSAIRFMLMNLYLVDQELDDICELADSIINKNQEDEFYKASLYYKAFALKHLEKNAEANKAYKEAISILRTIAFKHPEAIDAYLYRAMCHKDLEEYDKALELLDFVEGLNFNVAEIYTMRAEIYSVTGRPSLMNEQLNKAYELKPELKPDNKEGE